MSKFYLTSALPYINNFPHLGTCLDVLQADVLARYKRLKGEEVFFLTGTDEHGIKIFKSAEKANKDIFLFSNEMSAKFQLNWDLLNISHNCFIRTTDQKHIEVVKKIWQTLFQKGDIYKKKYQGFYCEGCEAFLTEKDLENGLCPDHKKEPEKIEEENYFFRLSQYKEFLKNFFEKNPNFITPKKYTKEALGLLENLEDISISRKKEKVKWGIEVPNDSEQVIYVWFDALLNYLSALEYPENISRFRKFWPADLQIVGKDIFRFHAIFWLAILKSLKLDLPKRLGVHGYLTIRKEKMSKSLGNFVSVEEAILKYGADTLRYFLLREIPFGEDGDFSFEKLDQRYKGDLADGLGNLASRILALASGSRDVRSCVFLNKNASQCVDARFCVSTWEKIEKSLEELKFHQALEEIWNFISFLDQYINQEKPWQSKDAKVIYNLVESLRHLGWMISFFMPETSEKILEALGVLEQERKESFDQIKKWRGIKSEMIFKKIQPLFPRK